MSRQAVTKHLNLLEEANLVATAKTRPREAALPQSRPHQRDLYALDRQVRAGPHPGASQSQTSPTGERPMTEAMTEFVYTTYITHHAAESVGRHHHPGIHPPILGQEHGLRLEARFQMGHGEHRRLQQRQYHRRGGGKPSAEPPGAELGRARRMSATRAEYSRVTFEIEAMGERGSPECRPRSAQGRFGNGQGHFRRLAAGAVRPQELPGNRQGARHHDDQRFVQRSGRRPRWREAQSG